MPRNNAGIICAESGPIVTPKTLWEDGPTGNNGVVWQKADSDTSGGC